MRRNIMVKIITEKKAIVLGEEGDYSFGNQHIPSTNGVYGFFDGVDHVADIRRMGNALCISTFSDRQVNLFIDVAVDRLSINSESLNLSPKFLLDRLPSNLSYFSK